MSDRKSPHDQFKDVYKKSPGTPSNRTRDSAKTAKLKAGGGSKSSKSSVKSVLGPKSAKSSKKHSGQRNPSSKKIFATHSKTSTRTTSKEMPNESGRTPSRGSGSKSPSTARTPDSKTTRTPKKSTKTEKWNGQDVQHKTEQCNTEFENDGDAPSGKGGGEVRLARAKIKERKLQWLKDGGGKDGKSPTRTTTDTTRLAPETSAAPDETEGKADKEEAKAHEGAWPATRGAGPSPDRCRVPEANKTLKDRTIFENDGKNQVAAVKEEKEKLQWLPGAEPTSPSPRKKKTTDHQPGEKAADKSPSPAKEQPMSPMSIYIVPILQHGAPSADIIKNNEPVDDEHGKKQ